jgi:RHS repeat-associated protein
MTTPIGARHLDAGVVHALLQARYYDGSKGEFLSEDPVFLGNPADQDLTNPQSLNSYSYANDNPINRSDPSGLGAGPLGAASAVVLAAIVAVLYAALTILSSPQAQHANSQAVSAILNQSTQIVQNLSSAHPLVNTGGTANTKSGVSVTPLNPSGSVPWTNINLSNSQGSSLPSPEHLTGKTPQEIDQIMKGQGVQGQPSRGGGVRYPVPGRPGDQVRIEQGNPGDPNPVKQGPYGRVSQNGVKSDPFPLAGNPTLNK